MKNTMTVDIKDLEMISGGAGEQMDEIISDAPAAEAPSVEAAPVRRAVRRKGVRMVKVNGVMKPYIYYYTEYV